MTRTDIPESFDERGVLLQMLRYTQETAVMKVRGLSQDQARLAPLPSSPLTSPANVLNHLRWVERSWINDDLLGGVDDGPWSEEEPDAEFAEGSALPLDDVLSLYEEEAARTRAVFAGIDLDTQAAGANRKEALNARWILVHLIEETARHNGHLDLLREMADGTVGD